ncbi:MAG: type II toxin-antitoxin system death-on-curing family toxin [Elusimicrobia bacterium]|nr:type II toxin-antitoxin system death-on-curing family toxin [Elusimicrobiota bacterium]
MKYLYPTQVLFLHKRILETSQGAPGVRDQGLLESAIYRPRASFGGQDLYPDLFSKAAALLHSIVKNHPFVDANKRTGFEAMRLFLRINGWDIKATEEEKFQWILSVASGSKPDEQKISVWIQTHAVRRNKPA